MSIRALLGLVFCNLIWSAHPAMSKFILADLGPVHSAWLRYSSAMVAYLFFCSLRPFSSRLSRFLREPFLVPKGFRAWALMGFLGFIAFCYSPLLQFQGLTTSQATDNALIIAMEPMLAILMAALILREKLVPSQILAIAVSLAGFALLSGIDSGIVGRGWDGHLFGNLLMLVSLLGEASYSSLGKKLVARHPPAAVFGTSLLLGTILLTLVTLFFAGVPDLSRVGWKAWASVLWLGPVGTMASYLFWLVVLTRVPVASISLTLFVQPVAGAAWGFVFLGEHLSASQAVGALLMLSGVFAPALMEYRSRPR